MPLQYLKTRQCLEVATIAKQYVGLSKQELQTIRTDLSDCFIVARCNGFTSLFISTLNALHAIEMVLNGTVYTFLSYNAFPSAGRA